MGNSGTDIHLHCDHFALLRNVKCNICSRLKIDGIAYCWLYLSEAIKLKLWFEN